MCCIEDECFQKVFNSNQNNMFLYVSPLTITFIKRNKIIDLKEDKLLPLKIGFPHLLRIYSENFEFMCYTITSQTLSGICNVSY